LEAAMVKVLDPSGVVRRQQRADSVDVPLGAGEIGPVPLGPPAITWSEAFTFAPNIWFQPPL
jgi:hypothetical protein